MGLQGSGKTTFCGKLAVYLKKINKNTLLVPLDIHRPAAVDQLKTISIEAGTDFLFNSEGKKLPDICAETRVYIRKKAIDVAIYDTAGRLQIDDEMMSELVQIQDMAKPDLNLLVLDSMTGQQAAEIARGFLDKALVNGMVLTKLDSDARGGAALSIFTETGKPIMFSTNSEKLDQLDFFYPDRMASRIIGMGDVMTLIEKAEEITSTEELERINRKVLKNELNLDDFLTQINEIKKMGSLNSIIEMLPKQDGFPKLDMRMDETTLVRAEAIIKSMTKKERMNPTIINSSRKMRIARGSGTQVNDINRLLKQFSSLKLLLSRSAKLKGKFMKKGFPGF